MHRPLASLFLYRCLFVLALIASLLHEARAAGFSDKKSDWHGFDRYELAVAGRPCIIVAPRQAAAGLPWIWRARFFGHEPQADLELLECGFHVAYCDVAGLYGSPAAVDFWDQFYAHVTKEYGFAPKAALEGMSRGGLIVYNWAAKNPDKVACIYGDAPVCDFKSWPGGKGKGQGSPGSWRQCLEAYGMTEEQALELKGNRIDKLQPLTDKKIKQIHVVGEADDVVPVAENTDIVEQRYRALGGSIQVIRKSGIGHHPHSLKDPTPIVQFILTNAVSAEKNVQLRGDLQNARIQFERNKRGRVAFMGGSITEMNGYRPLVCNLLKERFPETNFTFIDAGISSTCSTTGAFRLERDVLSSGKVDLFFIEFAVNDDQDAGHTREACLRGMEGIVRHCLRHNPQMDIVITYFVNPGMLAQLQAGQTPLTIAAHGEVARAYDISTINLAKQVAEQITAGQLTWKQFGGTHPAPFGNAICATMIDQLFTTVWQTPLPAAAVMQPHPIPASPIEPGNYENGRFVDPQTANMISGWEWKVPDWKAIGGSNRSRFAGIPLLSASQPNAELQLKFSGTAVGAFVLAGPDAGMLEASIDGGEFAPIDLYHRFSRGLHYPRTVMFAHDLSAGEHTLTVRTSSKTSSKGTAARILQFVAN